MNPFRIPLAGLLLCALPAYLAADPPTPDPLRTQVQTHLRIDIDKETDTVHFISTNNDPYIHTKTYVLQHADPYEIRPYLREAVGAERVSGSPAKVECIKYNDGTTFFIGGMEKLTVVKSVSKVPYLGDIPVIGWALSSESETTKKAQLVMVMNVAPIVPEQTIPAGSIGDIMKVKAATADAGTMDNYQNYGFDQFLLDDEKRRFDPLP